MKLKASIISLLLFTFSTHAAELHVAMNGSDTNAGTREAPLRTIQRGADLAQPGDTITVHAGVYREWVKPPRGGSSDRERITYQAALGEKVVITGSEPTKGWEKVSGDTWKLVLPNSLFTRFHPYVEQIEGDWFEGKGRHHHRGCVYLNDVGLSEARTLDAVLQPAGEQPLWFGKVDNVVEALPESLMSVAWFKVGNGAAVPVVSAVRKVMVQELPCSEGGQYFGSILHRSYARFAEVDFGAGAETVELRAAVPPGGGGVVELHLDTIEGELIGSSELPETGGDQAWKSFTIPITKTAGKRMFSLLFKQKPLKTYGPSGWGEKTTLWAQFPGVNPNEANVEIGMRPTVFTPTETNRDYITVRGFTLRNAATTWAGPCTGQRGLITAYWCKGWIIEENEIANSRCSGVVLGKYSDAWDGKRGNKEGYDLTIADALKTGGWTKEKIGSHIVRNNRIHHCGQTGVVGSLGCAFSSITGNVIHDIHLGSTFSGAETAGIKFHGAIDVKISGNHIYRCGEVGGIWLDWMGQGAQITGNFMHDNDVDCGDLFLEMQHGPILVANNLFLSKAEMYINSKGIAFAHNLMATPMGFDEFDSRKTPYHPPHATQIAGVYDGKGGDHRFYNNIVVAPAGLKALDTMPLPCFAAGNVFLKGAQLSKFDKEALQKPAHDAALKVTEKPDGWYLTVTLDAVWRSEVARKLVNTELLGKAMAPQMAYEEPDGSAISVNTDYLGNQRDTKYPFPGPFEKAGQGSMTIKVWPQTGQDS
jgi:hypothetical protein